MFDQGTWLGKRLLSERGQLPPQRVPQRIPPPPTGFVPAWKEPLEHPEKATAFPAARAPCHADGSQLWHGRGHRGHHKNPACPGHGAARLWAKGLHVGSQPHGTTSKPRHGEDSSQGSTQNLVNQALGPGWGRGGPQNSAFRSLFPSAMSLLLPMSFLLSAGSI